MTWTRTRKAGKWHLVRDGSNVTACGLPFTTARGVSATKPDTACCTCAWLNVSPSWLGGLSGDGSGREVGGMKTRGEV